jgi:tRNA-2-methylthio-N6-dimethylallyladenosine synthase
MEHFAAMVGQSVQVLTEAISRRRGEELSGRTSGNTVINFPGEASLIGQLVPVSVTGFGPNSLKGQLDLSADGGPHAH